MVVSANNASARHLAKNIEIARKAKLESGLYRNMYYTARRARIRIHVHVPKPGNRKRTEACFLAAVHVVVSSEARVPSLCAAVAT